MPVTLLTGRNLRLVRPILETALLLGHMCYKQFPTPTQPFRLLSRGPARHLLEHVREGEQCGDGSWVAPSAIPTARLPEPCVEAAAAALLTVSFSSASVSSAILLGFPPRSPVICVCVCVCVCDLYSISWMEGEGFGGGTRNAVCSFFFVGALHTRGVRGLAEHRSHNPPISPCSLSGFSAEVKWRRWRRHTGGESATSSASTMVVSGDQVICGSYFLLFKYGVWIPLEFD